jgi:phosphate transport system substrate-binding protein
MTSKNDTTVLIASLVITLGLLVPGAWWILKQTGAVNNTSSDPQPAPSSDPQPSLSPPAPTFAAVTEVPEGVFNYGGSTTWAPIRGFVDPAIQTVHPQFQLRYTDSPNAPPGSGTGITMLLNNQLAFAQSSRPLRPDEYEQAQLRGFTLVEVPVAIEGIAVAVHPDLDVPGLTVSQLRQIYQGDIVNWNQVGGPDLPITPYSRPMDGGTVEFFVDTVLEGNTFSSRVQFINTTTEALRAVSADISGIYYASAPEVVGQCTVKPLPLALESGQFVAPYRDPLIRPEQCPAQRNQLNTDVFISGRYPITREMLVIIRQDGRPAQDAGEAYANLLLSDQGQTLLEQAYFVPLR